MPDLLDIYNLLDKAPANAAGADSVSVEYRNPFEEFISTPKKTPAESSIKDLNERILEDELPKSKQYSTEDYESFIKYDLSPTEVSDYDKLVKQRAKNQSIAEQTWNSLVRAVGSEMGVGILKGFVDIGDFVYQTAENILNGSIKELNFNPDNSTLSEWSNYLQSVKDDIDKKHKIYRTNPNNPLDWKSFSWYADNFPSVATTVSLMVPSYTIMKGTSLIGKGASALLNKIPKFTTLADKAVNAMKLTPKTQEVLSALGKSSFMGLNSRIAENYQEAQQTYNQVKDIASKYLAAMTPKEREEWDKLNPEYKDMDDEEIANNIANAKANLTFKEDFSNLGFDILQIYTLHNALRSPRISNPRSLKTRNAKIANLFKEGKEITDAALKTTGVKNTILEKGKNFLYDSATLARAEWTEGVEEAVNFIAQEDALYATQALFGNYPYNREESTIKQFGILPYGLNEQQLQDYAHNPEMWEQFIWGAIGGILFGGVYNKAVPFMQQKFGKQNNIQDKQKELSLLARNNIQQQYLNNIDLIKENKNPFNLNESGEAQEFRNEAEKKAVTDLVQKQFLTDLVLNANQNGTIDLLQSYFENQDTVEGYTNRIGEQETKQLQKDVLDAINKITPAYNKNFNKARRNGATNSIATMLARQYTNAELSLDSFRNIENAYKAIFDDNVNNTSSDKSKITQHQDAYIIDFIRKTESLIATIEADNNILKNQKEEQLKDLRQQIEDARSLLSDPHVFEDIVSDEEGNPSYIFNENKYRQAVSDLMNVYEHEDEDLIGNMASYIKSRLDTINIQRDVNKNDDQIKDDIKTLVEFGNNATKEVKKQAKRTIKDLVKEYGKEKVVQHLNGEETDLNDETKEQLDNAREVLDDAEIINSANRAIREKEESKDKEKTANNEQLLGVEINNAVSEETENAEKEQNPSPVEENNENPLVVDFVKKHSSNIKTLPEFLNVYQEYVLNGDAQRMVSDISDVKSLLREIVDYLIAHNNTSISIEELEEFATKLYDAAPRSADSRFATVDAANLQTVIRNAILHKNQKTFEDFLNTVFNVIAKSKSFKNYPAYRINDIVYITGEGIGRLLSDFGYKGTISDEILDALKFYIASSKSEKFVIVDKDKLKEIKNNFSEYSTKSYAKRQADVKNNPVNSVSISDIGEKVDFSAFTKLQKGTKLIAKAVVDKKDASVVNIEIRTEAGEFIGYMASSKRDPITNEYQGVNKGWKYDIKEVNQPMKVASRFKEILVKIFRNNEKIKVGDREIGIVDYLYSADLDSLENADERIIREFYNTILNLGLKDFAYFKNPNKQQMIDAIRHIKNIFYRAINNRAAQAMAASNEVSAYDDLIYNDINNWFIKVFNGYNMAYVIANKTKKGKPVTTDVFVEDISYGFLNQDKGVYNNISVVQGYNHGDNKIVVCIKDRTTNEIYMVGDNEPIRTSGQEGKAYMKINSPGKSLYAELRQKQINQIKSSEIKSIVDSAINHLVYTVYDYFSKHKSIEDLDKELEYILGPHGLFYIPKDSGQISLSKGKNAIFIDYTANGKKQSIIINEYNKKGRTHSIIITDFPNDLKANPRYLLNEKINAYGFYNGNREINNQKIDGIYVGDEYKQNINVLTKIFGDIINNSTFAIDTEILKSDNVVSYDTKNPYIKRQADGDKANTIIKFRDNKEHKFDSYQQMLVDNGCLEIKLNNSTGTKTYKGSEISTSGNWQFNPNGSQLTVRINEKDTNVKGIIDYTAAGETNPLSIRIGSEGLHLTPQENETQLTTLIRDNELNLDYLKGYIAALSDEKLPKEEKLKIITHLENLEKMGLLNGKLRINNAAPLQIGKNGKPKRGTTKAFFSYKYDTDEIVIYRNNVNNVLNIREFVYGLVHENIHRTIKQTYDTNTIVRNGKEQRDIKERKKLYNEIEKVHRKVLDFIDSKTINYDGEDISVAEYLTRRSKELETNSRIWTTQDVDNVKRIITEYGIGNFTSEEEFLIESLTSPILMRFLNLIDSGEEIVETKRETLFDKILKIIADFLGIKINKNSILHELSELYKQFDKNEINIVTEEEEQLSVQEKEKINDESEEDDDYEYDEEEDTEEEDEANSMFAANSMTSLSESLPDEIQPIFDDLYKSGELSFACI